MDAQIGSRIRERRTRLRIKQTALANVAGISPAYLNLIEHNKRRIGGKLLIEIAEALDVEVSALTDGASAGLIAGLRAISNEQSGGADQAQEKPEEIAARFPYWAGMIVQQHDQLRELEQQVDALNDRLAHDPFLSESLHEILSAVTAVRSAAGILNGDGGLDPEWQRRFLRNMYEDSQRLAAGAQSLATYMDTLGEQDRSLGATPLEEFTHWLEARAYSLESEDAPALLKSSAAKMMASQWQERAEREATRMPIEMVDALIAAQGPDPSALAREADVPLAMAMSRLGNLPPSPSRPPMGLLRCDGTGGLTFSKPLDRLTPPRFGAGCPIWPLYQALLRPGRPILQAFHLEGQAMTPYVGFAICERLPSLAFDAPDVIEATMLYVGREHFPEDAFAQVPSRAVGTSCRVCPKADCVARREPSLVMSDGV